VIRAWRAEAALTPGYFLSRLQRDDLNPFVKFLFLGVTLNTVPAS